MTTEWFRNASTGQKVMITVAVFIVILLVMALYGFLTGAWEEDAKEHTQTELRPSLAWTHIHKVCFQA